MKKQLLLLSVLFTCLFQVKAQEIEFSDYGNEPSSENIGFVANMGQVIQTDDSHNEAILYHSVRSVPSTFYLSNQISFVFAKIDSVPNVNDTSVRIDFRMLGENVNQVNPTPYQLSNEKINFYLPQCTTGCEGLEIYRGLIYEELYSGINLRINSNNMGMKMYFEVKPEANPENIEFEISGSDLISVNSGYIVVGIANFDYFVIPAPTVYQIDGNGGKTLLNWKPDFENTTYGIGFDLGGNTYDKSKTLVFVFEEPSKLTDGTNRKNLSVGKFAGGSGWDEYWDIDILHEGGGEDGPGFPYVSGYTKSLDFPVDNNICTGSISDGNILVVKYDVNLNRIWTTVYGGSNEDGYLSYFGISLNTNGEAFIAATACSDIQLKDISGTTDYKDEINPSQDQVIARFDLDGKLTWATFFGGTGASESGDIIIDKSDNSIYVAGYEYNLPDLVDPGNNAHFETSGNAFIAKFGSDLHLNWSTYFGLGTAYDNMKNTRISSLAIDNENKLVIVGHTAQSSTCPAGTCTFPTQTYSGAASYSFGGNIDSYIARFNQNLNLEWSTYFGSSPSADYANKVIVTNDGKMAVTGNLTATSSNFLNVSSGGAATNQSAYGGNGTNWYGDAYLTTFSSAGIVLNSTYLGGSSGDKGLALTSPRYGLGPELFVGGHTTSDNMPATPNTQSSTLYFASLHGSPDNYRDGFLCGYDGNFEKKWSTYVGGSGTSGWAHDEIYSMQCFEQFIYIVGSTESDDFEPIYSTPATTNKGKSDGFILKFYLEGTPLNLNKTNINKQSFNIYPNPTKNILNLDLNGVGYSTKTSKVNIFDTSGRKVFGKEFKSNEELLVDITGLFNGFYVIEIEIDNMSKVVSKFIKE